MEHRTTYPSSPGGLGRLPLFDDKDRMYPAMSHIARSVVTAGEDEIREINRASERGWRYWWTGGWWGNQERTPQCVAYAALHAIEDGPITAHPFTPGVGPILPPHVVYRGAQDNDEWPGRNYEGTSARGAGKWLRDQGIIESFRWIWTLEHLIETLMLYGPVMFGSIWMSGMDNTDEDGFVQPTGSFRGGHETLANGVNVNEEKIRFKNSWGRSWGDEGHFWMKFEHVRLLLEESDGDAMILVEKEYDDG